MTCSQTKSEPADGAALPQPPDKVTVWFPEEVLAETSSLKVFDAQGRQVDQGKGGVDLTDASHQVMVVESAHAGARGVYGRMEHQPDRRRFFRRQL